MLFLCSVSILGIIWNYDYNIQGNNSCYAKILLPHIRILKVFVKTYKVWPTVAWGIFLMCNHGMLCGGGGVEMDWDSFLSPASQPSPSPFFPPPSLPLSLYPYTHLSSLIFSFLASLFTLFNFFLFLLFFSSIS